ncbi:hypothetical protein ACF064_21950 [Streptomyces sp. NPDC015492]|uniref:hypothetical protein n=1 Tax=unclassified Streptomyces TaxID=2593676 RepID=UPI0033DB1EF9
MPVEYTVEGHILALRLRDDLDVTARAAAAMHVQRLVLAHRPEGVRLHLVAGLATGASLSVLARVRRLCESLDIPLVISDQPWAARAPFAPAVAEAVGT